MSSSDIIALSFHFASTIIALVTVAYTRRNFAHEAMEDGYIELGYGQHPQIFRVEEGAVFGELRRRWGTMRTSRSARAVLTEQLLLPSRSKCSIRVHISKLEARSTIDMKETDHRTRKAKKKRLTRGYIKNNASIVDIYSISARRSMRHRANLYPFHV